MTWGDAYGKIIAETVRAAAYGHWAGMCAEVVLGVIIGTSLSYAKHWNERGDSMLTSVHPVNGAWLLDTGKRNGIRLVIVAGMAISILVASNPALAYVSMSFRAPDWIVYSDSTGIPPDAEVYVWPHPPTGDSVDLAWPGGCDIDPPTCARTVATSWAGWGIFLTDPEDHTVDLVSAGCTALEFWVRSPCDRTIGVEDEYGRKSAELVGNHGWSAGNASWQFISIPIEEFGDGPADLTRIYGVFLVTAKTTCTFCVDHVAWTPCDVSVDPTHWGRIKVLYR